jgi:hypothetical protein
MSVNMSFGRYSAFILVSTALVCQAATFQESFSTDPSSRGWRALGETNLFSWNAQAGVLEVTWDSSKSNSFFAQPLGVALTKRDDFIFEFDLRLNDCVAGVDSSKPNPFQLAVSLVNLDAASSPSFIRGSGFDPQLLEFNYFPDPGGAWQWGPSLTAEMVDATGTNWSSGGFFPGALTTNLLYHIRLAYTATNQTLRATITAEGQAPISLGDAVLGASFTDLAVDHFAISSYTDAGQDPVYAGSILAHGAIDNVRIELPQIPTLKLDVVAAGASQHSVTVRFFGLFGWRYMLERSTDLVSWSDAGNWASGQGAELQLEDPLPPANAFYKVRASRE